LNIKTLFDTILSLFFFYLYKKGVGMTQIIITIEDLELLPELKWAIKMLRGVKDITVCRTTDIPNKATKQAIKE